MQETLNMLGSYGQWAAELQANQTRRLSYLEGEWESAVAWRRAARREFGELIGLACSRFFPRNQNAATDSSSNAETLKRMENFTAN